MHEFPIPVALAGPGTQPAEADGANLDILQLPDEMATFRMPEVPVLDEPEQCRQGLAALHQLEAALQIAAMRPGRVEAIEITGLDAQNVDLIDQVLGEGEVSMIFQGRDCSARIQESVLAGVWRVKHFDQQGALTQDSIEVAPVPKICRRHVFTHSAHRVEMQRDAIPAGVLNAPPLLAEINDKIAEYRPRAENHVINLTLLPQTEEDLAFLIERLGEGRLTILSRGYGNCRITSTATEHVWWVQYFNSQDRNILNTLEIGDVPSVALAAEEDIQDSAVRLSEILEIYR
jgi:hydrogenase-1 operon protein HyaF